MDHLVRPPFSGELRKVVTDARESEFRVALHRLHLITAG
jgi:hypothetical protein